MKAKFRLFRRSNGIFFLQDRSTGRQESLQTRDSDAAERIAAARNEAHRLPAMNLQIARAYLYASDPGFVNRSWQHVMSEVAKTKKGETFHRWNRAMSERPFDVIRDVKLIETRAEQFVLVLQRGGVSTNVFVRRLHNYALDMNWLPMPIIPRKHWPGVSFQEKRGITFEEHERILSIEQNAERRFFYELLWHLGGSQSDIASLKAEDVDRNDRVVSYRRQKSNSLVLFRFGNGVAKILEQLPTEGFLFPRISQHKESDRAKQFWRSCNRLGISGVSLHSYRYAWAERAKQVGYPERFAQEALGHNSKAVHRVYAKKAQVKVPSLEEFG